jgi:Holliday junction resolvasome RuvABC DNA-binding subunit
MLLVSSAQLPALSQIIFSFSAQKPRLAQKQQHKQQQQQQQQTKQQTIAKPFQNLSGLGFDWLQFKRGPNEVQTRSKRGPKSNFGRLTP